MLVDVSDINNPTFLFYIFIFRVFLSSLLNCVEVCECHTFNKRLLTYLLTLCCAGRWSGGAIARPHTASDRWLSRLHNNSNLPTSITTLTTPTGNRTSAVKTTPTSSTRNVETQTASATVRSTSTQTQADTSHFLKCRLCRTKLP